MRGAFSLRSRLVVLCSAASIAGLGSAGTADAQLIGGCVLYPNPCIDQTNETVGALDENRQPATAPPFVHEAVVGPVTGVLAAYAQGTNGPLSVEAGVDSVTSGDAANRLGEAAQRQPVSTGSCDLRGPTHSRSRDAGRANSGEGSYFYAAGVGVDCAGGIKSAYCYIELWRARDGAMVDNGSTRDSGGRGMCTAHAYSNFYRSPNRHYAKAAVTMTTYEGQWWGNGRGPRGWDCSGQGSTQLTCRRDTAPEA